MVTVSPTRARDMALCRDFVDRSAEAYLRRGVQEASRCVARTADVSVLCPRVLRSDNINGPFAGLSKSPLTDSNRRPPSLPFWGHGNWSQPTATVFARLSRFRPLPFATDCHWLRPLGSINAPSRVVSLG